MLQLFEYINKFSVWSPAFHAFERGQIDTTKFLSSTGSDVNMARLVVAFPPKDNITSTSYFSHACNTYSGKPG